MIESLEARFKEQQRIKNGQLVDSSPNTKVYARLRRRLTEFTKEKYGKAFSTFFFPDINEQFLLDFAFLIKENGIKNGNKGGLATKLRRLRAVCNYAHKEGMYGVRLDAFECLGV